MQTQMAKDITNVEKLQPCSEYVIIHEYAKFFRK